MDRCDSTALFFVAEKRSENFLKYFIFPEDAARNPCQTAIKDTRCVCSLACSFISSPAAAAHLSLPFLRRTSHLNVSLCELGLNWAQMPQSRCGSVSCFMLLWKLWLPDCFYGWKMLLISIQPNTRPTSVAMFVIVLKLLQMLRPFQEVLTLFYLHRAFLL